MLNLYCIYIESLFLNVSIDNASYPRQLNTIYSILINEYNPGRRTSYNKLKFHMCDIKNNLVFLTSRVITPFNINIKYQVCVKYCNAFLFIVLGLTEISQLKFKIKFIQSLNAFILTVFSSWQMWKNTLAIRVYNICSTLK